MMYFQKERGSRWDDVHFDDPICGTLLRRDFLTIFALLLWTLVLNLPGLGSLEFFRHTEADRTLIAWEMLDRRDFLIPHILGSEILTKPPIFYWMVAAAIHLFGEPAEWVARLPSTIAGALLVITQFVFLRKAGASYILSTLTALSLSTGILFLNLASSAEIDMVYGLFSTVTLSLLYFGIASSRPLPLLGAYFVAALAFLTKGPPILAFFATTLIVFSLWRMFRDQSPPPFFTIPRFIVLNLLGACIFIVVAGSWIVLVAERVGWDALVEQFRVEILDRFFHPSHRERGFFYYFLKLPVNLLPWTPLIVVGLLAPFHSRSSHKYSEYCQRRPLARFFFFHIVVVLGSILILSLAEGKSTRYMFPVYPFAMNLVALAILFLKDSDIPNVLYRICRLVGATLCVLALVGPFGVAALTDPALFRILPAHLTERGEAIQQTLAALPFIGIAVVAIAIAIASFLLAHASRRSHAAGTLLGLLLLASIWRLSERTLYAPFRNATRSVQSLSNAIQTIVPPDAPIYTVEMFERWVVYYLKRDGRKLTRVSPQLVESFRTLPAERVYLLLSGEEESWRLEQLQLAEPTTRSLGSLREGLDHLLVVETSSKALQALHVHRMIPTVPSKPFYAPEGSGV